MSGAVLSIPGVQTELARYGMSYLHDEFGIDVDIKKATFRFPNVVHLEGVYAPDHTGDTLIYAEHIDFGFLGFSDNKLTADKIHLNGGKLLMRKYEHDTLYNFAIWLEHFTTDEPVDTLSPEFALHVSDISVRNFRYAKNPIGCDTCTWLDFYDADLRVADFLLNGSYVEADIERMGYRDERRFSLYDFRAKASYQANFMALERLYFKTDESVVKGDVRLEYRTLDDFSDFLNLVRIKGHFDEAAVSSEEFQSYIPQFPSFDRFEVNGEFKGTVNDLYANKMDVALGNTRFFGDVHLTDCTEPSDLYLDAFVGYCETNGEDLQRYVNPFLEEGLPEVLTSFSYIDLSGHYEGTLQSFETRGEVRSNHGDANINIAFKELGNPDKAGYSGNLSLMSFDLGGLLNQPDLGTITASGSVKGVGMTAATAEAELDLVAPETEYGGYIYRNIKVDGSVADRLFKGDFAINDPRVNLNFTGELDFRKDTATLDFVAGLDSADLYTLGWLGDTVAWLGADVAADFLLYKDEWWQGQIMIDSVKYTRGNQRYSFDQFVLNSSNAGNITRNAIDSDLLEGYIEGEYKIFEIHKPILAALSSISSVYPYEYEDEPSFTNCHFELQLKKPDLLTELFLPGVRLAPRTRVMGDIRSSDGFMKLLYETEGMDLFGTYVDTTSLRLSGVYGKYNLSATVNSVFDSENLESDDILLKSTFLKDSAMLSLRGILRDSVDSDIKLDGYVLMPGKDTVTFHWDEARFNVGVDTLRLNAGNRLTISSGRMAFENYNFIGRTSELSINGTISPEPYEILRLNLRRLDMSVVNYLIRDENTIFSGTATGMMILNDVFNRPMIAGDMRVDSLSLNGARLGKLDFGVSWDVYTNVTRLDGGLTLGTLNTLGVSGRIAQDSTEPLLIDIDLDRFRIAAFNPYLQGILDNLRGTIEGTIHLAGTLKKPTLDGELRLPNAAFGIPFLGTDYNFEGSPLVRLSSDRILLDRVKVRDTREGTSGFASGVISHKNLSDLKFDLSIQADHLLGLDTDEGENNYFYGKAYASGLVRIVGPTDQMNLEINVEAEEGTEVMLPLSSPTEVGQNQFITFVDPNEKIDSTAFGFERKVKMDNLGGLSISVDVNVKPSAKVVVTQEAMGVIHGQGAGLIHIDLTSTGDLNIMGNYTVSEGEYTFNLQNIISKKFKIEPGSRLSWSGDPFDAEIDLYALYRTRTTLTGMVSEASGYAGQRVNVNLIMHLTGPAMNPNISFEIEVPNVSTAWQEEIRNRLSDQDKLMDNAFSLLVTNSFWNPDNSLVEGVVQQNVDQMTSVISNWAAKSVFGDFADISLDLHRNTDPTNANTGSEVGVNVSRSFADDRIVVNSNLDIPIADGTADPASGTQQTLTGDIEVEYKITEDGRIRAKAFNRSNQNNPGLDQLSAYTQGVSVYYRADFNTWEELMDKVFGRKPENTEPEEDTDPALDGEESQNEENSGEPADSSSVTPGDTSMIEFR